MPLEDDKGKGKKAESELKELKTSLSDTKPVGDLVQLAKTVDQVCMTLNSVGTWLTDYSIGKSYPYIC